MWDPVPVQMWEGRGQSWCRCGQGDACGGTRPEQNPRNDCAVLTWMVGNGHDAHAGAVGCRHAHAQCPCARERALLMLTGHVRSRPIYATPINEIHGMRRWPNASWPVAVRSALLQRHRLSAGSSGRGRCVASGPPALAAHTRARGALREATLPHSTDDDTPATARRRRAAVG